jgi:hypothetical protein
MDVKTTKAFRIKKSNVDKVIAIAKKNRRNIGDSLDIIIESYFEKNVDDEKPTG